jgi:hypothetical protein
MDPRSTLVAHGPAKLDVVRDGEILFAIDLAPGIHRVRPLLATLPRGCEFQASDNLVVIDPPLGYGVQPYGKGSHESGANPDFQPTSASRLEKQMRVAVAHMQAATKRLDAREKALASVERIPTAPAPKQEAEEPVVE